MEKLITTHACEDDNGTVYYVREYRQYIDASSQDEPGAVIPGMKRFALIEGGDVNFIDANTFLIVIGNRTVRRIG